MRGNRLYLSMPQIILKTVANKDSSKMLTNVPPLPLPNNEKNKDRAKPQPGTFGSLTDAPMRSATSQKQWEVKMCWSEYIEGRWSPKRISPGRLTVAEPLPSVSQFSFEPEMTASNKLSIVVRVAESADQTVKIGQFDFYEEQVSASTSYDRTKYAKPIPTKFQKFFQKNPSQTTIDSKF